MDSPFDEEPPEKGKDFASDEASTIRQRKQCIDRLSASLKHQYEVLGFDDHFTLRQPSAGVTFRGESVYVYELNSSQVQLRVSQKDACAESKDTQDSFKIEIRDVPLDRSEQVSLLRLTYTLVAMFCMATVSLLHDGLPRENRKVWSMITFSFRLSDHDLLYLFCAVLLFQLFGRLVHLHGPRCRRWPQRWRFSTSKICGNCFCNSRLFVWICIIADRLAFLHPTMLGGISLSQKCGHQSRRGDHRMGYNDYDAGGSVGDPDHQSIFAERNLVGKYHFRLVYLGVSLFCRIYDYHHILRMRDCLVDCL